MLNIPTMANCNLINLHKDTKPRFLIYKCNINELVIKCVY